MNEPPHEKPVPLAIDVDQWRRDIQTFASTTKQALDGIVSELSNQCAGKQNSTAPLSSAPRESVDSAPLPHSPSSQPAEVDSSVNREGRLTNLKHKLAQRIAKNS